MSKWRFLHFALFFLGLIVSFFIETSRVDEALKLHGITSKSLLALYAILAMFGPLLSYWLIKYMLLAVDGWRIPSLQMRLGRLLMASVTVSAGSVIGALLAGKWIVVFHFLAVGVISLGGVFAFQPHCRTVLRVIEDKLTIRAFLVAAVVLVILLGNLCMFVFWERA